MTQQLSRVVCFATSNLHDQRNYTDGEWGGGARNLLLRPSLRYLSLSGRSLYYYNPGDDVFLKIGAI